jgi:PAS domain S-box-containing protein
VSHHSASATPEATRAVPAEGNAERLLEGIIARTEEAVVCTDDAERIILFNPAAERIFGYGRHEVLGQSIDFLRPRSARGAPHAESTWFRSTAAEHGETAERIRVWWRRRSGELFPAESGISTITVGETTYFAALLRDVTQQRRTEKERAALLARTRASRAAAEAAQQRIGFLADASEILHSSLAIESTFDALLHLIVPEHAICCVVDLLEADGIVRRSHVMHGDPAMQALAERLARYPQPPQTRYLTRQAIEEQEPKLVARVSDDFLRTNAEDDEHYALLRDLQFSSLMILPLRVRGRVLGAVMLARGPGGTAYTEADLTLAQAVALRAASALDNARLYDEARRAVRARDDVLGVVSHDLRTPLSVIAMCATALLGEGLGDGISDHETIQTIQRSAHWAQRLIQDLVDVRVIEAGGLSLARRLEDPRTLVTRAILLHAELANERKIELAAELPDELPAVHVDADRIVQALGNVIGNAVKFTPYGGTVRVRAVDREDEVRFVVTDSGPGISPDHAPHVFDRFWTAPSEVRVRGTGMGLAIARGIIDAHGGRIWLEPARVGEGATFCIELVASDTV